MKNFPYVIKKEQIELQMYISSFVLAVLCLY